MNNKETKKASIKKILLAVAIVALGFPMVQGTQGAHPNSETPGSSRAVLFSPLVNDAGHVDNLIVAEVKSYLEDHAYDITLYVDNSLGGSSDGDPQSANASNFHDALSNARGIFFVSSHGDHRSILVEGRGTQTACNDNRTKYINSGLYQASDLECDTIPGTGGWGIWITDVGIQRHFLDSETIVYLLVCSSWPLRNNFTNVREFLAYEIDVGCVAFGRPDANSFWGRMHGQVNNGLSRPVSVAYTETEPLGRPLRWHHRPDTPDTVLSPAVKDYDPLPSTFLLPAGGTLTVNGHVEFDTPMENVDVLDVSGTCDPWLKGWSWPNNQRFEFELQLNQTGDVELRVQQEVAKAGTNYHNNLDGNQNKSGTIHVGPNRDDFVWDISCREQEEGNTTVGGHILDWTPASPAVASQAVMVAIMTMAALLLVGLRRKN